LRISVRRFLVLVILLPLCLLGNGAIVHSFQLAEPLDLDWLARHCTDLPEADRATLPQRIVLDHELFDVDYFYDPPMGKSFWATRSGVSKAFCLGGIGCLTAPVVMEGCLTA
jgi:hypothetical protein